MQAGRTSINHYPARRVSFSEVLGRPRVWLPQEHLVNT
jgi:hypothetical protein